MVKLTYTELDVRDREWVERVLPPDDELLLVCKPRPSLWRKEYIPTAFVTVLWLGMVATISFLVVREIFIEGMAHPGLLLFLLFLVPFWVVGYGLVSSPWRERERDRRTIYLLTNRRVLLLRPSDFRLLPVEFEYVLKPGMILDVTEKRDGSGSIVLEYVERSTRNGVHLIPRGFLHVPQVRRVEEILRQQIAAEYPELPAEDPESEKSAPFVAPEPFPSVISPVVGAVFIGAGVRNVCEGVTGLQQVTDGWLMTALVVVVAPLFILFMGAGLVWAWCRRMLKYLRKRRRG